MPWLPFENSDFTHVGVGREFRRIGALPDLGGQDPAAPLRDKTGQLFLILHFILRLWEFHNKALEEAREEASLEEQ